MSRKIILLLVVIFLLATVLRFYKINEVPVSLYWDEVSSTYNAYSLLNTGNDEFGNNHPLLFRAFEDYKTPANIYLTIAPVALFGVNEFSARFTSAFLGSLTIILVYFLTIELISKDFLRTKKEYIGLTTALFVAISPWHIQFSRTGFEANVGLFFVILASYLFIKFIRDKANYLLYSSFGVFALSIYFYRSIWVFVPLLVLALLLIYRKEVGIKKSLIALSIFAIILLPFVPKMVSSQGLVRAQQVNVIDNSKEETAKFVAKQTSLNGPWGKVVYNRRVSYAITVVRGYVGHFGPTFLFLNGDGNPRHGVPGVGVLYIWAIFLIVPGFFALFKIEKKTALTIIAWLFLSPIPAAVSLPSPHALRSLNLIPIPQLICVLGLVLILSKLSIVGRKVFLMGGALVIGFFFITYLQSYYGKSAVESSSGWGDGYKQLSRYVFTNESKFDKVIVSGHYWQPYAYFLFYKKYDPLSYQQTGNKSGFDKYVFGGTSWDNNGKELGDQNLRELGGEGKILVALSPVEYEMQKNNIDVATRIINHNNELVFIVGVLK